MKLPTFQDPLAELEAIDDPDWIVHHDIAEIKKRIDELQARPIHSGMNSSP
jgi:hypothetical protein